MKSFFIHYVTIPLFRTKGLDGLKALTEFEKSQWLSPAEIEDNQWRKIENILSYSVNFVPYYKKVLTQNGISINKIIKNRSLEVLPILDRTIIRKEGDNLIAVSVPPDRKLKNSTGGSTGEPLSFYDDMNGSGSIYAAYWRSEGWCGSDLGERQVYLWGSNFDLSKYQSIMGRIRNWASNLLMLPAWELSQKNAKSFLVRTIKFRPRLLIGYAGAVYQWARLLGFERQHIPNLRSIIVSAETLYPDWRVAIEQTFGVPVYNRYGGRDTKFIAQECSVHHGLHIASENCYLEVVRNGHRVNPGELGEIVITRFDNWVMPFIRYQTGDLGVPSDRHCECGRGLPLLESVDGRIQDALQTADGKIITGLFFAHLLKDFSEIKTFQVHQLAVDRLKFLLVLEPAGYFGSKDRIDEIIHSYMGSEVKIDYEFRDQIPLTPSGKRRITISYLHNPFPS